MSQAYSVTFSVAVYRGRNNFLPITDASFAGDQQVTLSFGANTATAPAVRYGPYPRRFLLQIFPLLQSALLFARPAGLSDAAWAAIVANEHFNGAQRVFKPDIFAHAIKNAILDHFFHHFEADPRSVGYTRGKRYYVDKELVDYLFYNHLWTTQFGRAVLYILRKETQQVGLRVREDTLDANVLPISLQVILETAEQDSLYLPWYFELLRLLLIEIEMVRPFSGDEQDGDSIAHFCGVAHHHRGEPRCTDAPLVNGVHGGHVGDGYWDSDMDEV